MKPFDFVSFLNANGKKCYPGEPMSAVRFASVLKRKCGMVEARATVLGYTQRGASPTYRDSAFAFEAGRMAVELLTDEQIDLKQGFAIGVRDGRVYSTPFADALDESKKKFFDEDLYHLVNTL